jgi:hypothetical protein
MQKMCRTTIEFEPPPNESVRAQEVGRVKRKGCYSTWIRHISLLTKDTFNTKQDSESILKNLPNLLTQLDLDIWGKGEEDKNHELGEFVLYKDRLYPADDEKVLGKPLETLDADNLLLHISLQLLGRKPDGNIESLRKQILEDKRGKYEDHAEVDPLWVKSGSDVATVVEGE